MSRPLDMPFHSSLSNGSEMRSGREKVTRRGGDLLESRAGHGSQKSLRQTQALPRGGVIEQQTLKALSRGSDLNLGL